MTIAIEPTALPTSRFATVSLAELIAEADLQTRVDRKYLMPTGNAAMLLDRLPSRTRVLQIDDLRSFGYESVYFDTPDLECYLAAARRRRRRFKVRTRLYTDSGLCRLEVKTRDRRRQTVKSAVEYDHSMAGRLTPSGYAHIAAAVPDQRGPLYPVLATVYRRTTLLLPGGSRLTIDSSMTVSTLGTRDRRAELPGLAIVETKGIGRPGEADRVLWSLGHRPMRISKYGTGLALLRPDLPANKWTPALTRIDRAAQPRRSTV